MSEKNPTPVSNSVGSAEEILASSDAHDDESLWRFWNEKACGLAAEVDQLRGALQSESLPPDEPLDRKIAGVIRKLHALHHAFDMKGTNSITMLRAINTLSVLENRSKTPPKDNVVGIIDRFDQAYPELYWHVAKGKITAEEPLYGAAIFTGDNIEMGIGESDESAEEAFRIALEDAGLSLSDLAKEGK